MEFKRAIVREISDSYLSCISGHPHHSSLNLKRAREQHRSYKNTLEELGLELIVLQKENEYPDACFVEDNVIIYQDKAFINRMGATSRRGEERSVYEILKQYKTVKHASSPATIEGGDVIHLNTKLICGLSSRTNAEGIKQASEWLDIQIDTILGDFVHLKSYVTYLGSNVMISTKQFIDHPLLSDFDLIEVPADERYAANTLTIGETVILPVGNPKLNEMIIDRGFETIQLKTDQFELCEGALTCLSILF